MNITEARAKAAPKRPAAKTAMVPPKPAPEQGSKPPRWSRASAARCLGVGLVCFGVWLLLDANKLYLAAQASPLGSRRTVAIILLRPLAAVTNAVGLSSLVNGANDALGRANAPGSDSTGPNFDPVVTDPGDIYATLPPLPHRIFGLKIERYQSVPQGPPPIPRPTAAHPLVMLEIGDSLGQDLGFGLGDQFGGDSRVVVDQQAQESTGLANPGYYNWAAHLEQDLAQFHPKVVVVMLGGNDAQNFMQFNQGVVFGSALWRIDYGERVAQIMDEATAAGAHVLWVGLPIMQDPTFSHQMAELNSVFAAQAWQHPGVTYYPSWKLFSTPAGQYSAYLRTPSGQEIEARDNDGVHLAPAGWDYLAAALVKPMETAWRISLGQ
jgi:lysophospholipase L1-like esterase